MTKIAVNSCYGGFGLSKEAVLAIAKRKGMPELFVHDEGHGFVQYTFIPWEEYEAKSKEARKKKDYEAINKMYFYPNWERDDADMIAVIEELGCKKASGALSDIRIVEVPDDVSWGIEEYDGKEWVAESHRTW